MQARTIDIVIAKPLKTSEKQYDMKNIDVILSEIKSVSSNIIGDDLVGVYIHGSYAFGCYNPHKSDIDYLVVVNSPMTEEKKLEYLTAVLRINEAATKKGIEMSVVLRRHCENFTYPTPFELHFSNSHLRRISEDIVSYCREMNGVDRDLAAHFTVTRAVGIKLCGEPIQSVFSPVPHEAYLDSIASDVENAASDIFENPVYVILNLCRVAAYVNDGAVISKADGGMWGLRNLPIKYHGIITDALDVYHGEAEFSVPTRRETLAGFAEYMLRFTRTAAETK